MIRFEKGDRVVMTREAQRTGIGGVQAKRVTGVVISRLQGPKALIRVRQDGLKDPKTFAASFWEHEVTKV